MSLSLNAGDAVTVVVGSNGGDSTINFEGPSGVEASEKFLASGAKAQELKFYPRETGNYKFYSTDVHLHWHCITVQCLVLWFFTWSRN